MAEQSFKVDGGIEATGIVTASTFTKQGGTSTQFLKADGSVDSRSFSTSDTTYDISANDTGVANRKYIRLTNSGAGTTDVVLKGGSNVTINRTNNELEIASSYTDTDTTYGLSAVSDGSNESIILTAGGSGSGISSVSFVPGSSISLSRSGNNITIGFGDENGDVLTNGDVRFNGTSGQYLEWDKSQSALEFQDGARANFGTNNDLRISHTDDLKNQQDSEGNNILAGNDWCSYIEDAGTGPIVFKSDGGPGPGAFQFYDTNWNSLVKMHSGTNSRVALFHTGKEKLATSEHGIDVTGHVEADTLHVSGISTFSGLADVNGEVKVGTGITIGVAGVATAHNLHVGGILKGKSNNNQLAYDSHWIPTTNAAYDIGSAEFKVRHLFLSDNSLKFVDSSNNEYPVSISSGNLNYSSGFINDTQGDLRRITNNGKTAAYTLTANDQGGLINTNSDVTVPSGQFVAGQAVTIFNNSGGNISIKRSGTTIWTAGTDTNTDKTLARKGICTIVCVSQNGFVISGAGLT